VHENTRTYGKFGNFGGNCMSLEIKDLQRRRGRGEANRDNQKMKDEPTMLLKTKENKSDILDDPTIFMKIKDLCF
jgi:hypothetical protein